MRRLCKTGWMDGCMDGVLGGSNWRPPQPLLRVLRHGWMRGWIVCGGGMVGTPRSLCNVCCSMRGYNGCGGNAHSYPKCASNHGSTRTATRAGGAPTRQAQQQQQSCTHPSLRPQPIRLTCCRTSVSFISWRSMAPISP
eukprot:223482-Chlamydomonas_euryale.AAC.2